MTSRLGTQRARQHRRGVCLRASPGLAHTLTGAKFGSRRRGSRPSSRVSDRAPLPVAVVLRSQTGLTPSGGDPYWPSAGEWGALLHPPARTGTGHRRDHTDRAMTAHPNGTEASRKGPIPGADVGPTVTARNLNPKETI